MAKKQTPVERPRPNDGAPTVTVATQIYNMVIAAAAEYASRPERLRKAAQRAREEAAAAPLRRKFARYSGPSAV